MQAYTQTGMEVTLQPAEELVPHKNWFTWFFNVADRCRKEARISLSKGGYKYKDVDYWQVLVYRGLNQCSTKEAADEMDELLFENSCEGRGRKPSKRKQLGGKYPRRERHAPNESQVNDFLRRMPKWIKKKLRFFIFKAQVDIAVEMGLLDKVVEVYIDYTERDYYGDDRFPANPCITGTFKGAGTNRARKYGAVMISSGKTRLFAGIFLTRKGEPKEAYIGDALRMLMEWGFTIKEVFGDREFSTYDLIATLNSLDIPYTGSMKKTVPVKKCVDDYLDGKSPAVFSHELNEHQYTRVKAGTIHVHVIMKTDPGQRLRNVRRDFQKGKFTRGEARKKIHVFVTTRRAPRAKHRLTRWGMGVVKRFRKRWRLETGFRDCDRFTPTSHARSNETKTFMFVLDAFLYNAWQIQRALHRRLKGVPASWREGPTLRRFCHVVTRSFIKEKK